MIWIALLEGAATAAATEFGKEFGSRMGEKIAEALGDGIDRCFNNLLGGDANQSAEAWEQLAGRLSTLIDVLLQLAQDLSTRLPQIVYTASQLAILEKAKLDLATSWNRIQAGQGDPVDDQIRDVLNAIDEVETILRYGSKYHSLGLVTLNLALGVARRLPVANPDLDGSWKEPKGQLTQNLSGRARGWQRIMDTWMDPENTTEVKRAFDDRLWRWNRCTAIANAYQEGVPFFLIRLVGPIQTQVDGAPLLTYHGEVGWLEKGPTPGTWVGRGPKALKSIQVRAQIQTWGEFLKDVVPGTPQRPIQLDWYPAKVNDTTGVTTAEYINEVALELGTIYKTAQSLPAEIGALTEIIDGTQALRKVCASLQPQNV